MNSLSSEHETTSFPSGLQRAQRTQFVCSAKLCVNRVLNIANLYSVSINAKILQTCKVRSKWDQTFSNPIMLVFLDLETENYD